MASFANLSSEERIGLGIAAVAHVALVAGLMWQVRDEPAKLPTPERIEVSLAEDVSLRSTAPDPVQEQQAAIAPVLAEQPAPAPAPEPEPIPEPPLREIVRPAPQPTREVVRPAPAPRPTASARPTPEPRPSPRATPAPRPSPSASARPSPRPSASARPAPTPSARPTAARSGGSRIGADFLEGASSGERTEARGTPAATFGAAEQASLNSAISRQIKPHWSAPSGVDVEKLVTLVRFRLNPDGSLSGRPVCVSQTGETPSNAAQKELHCERAIRAVQLAAPFDLPDEFYENWKLVTSRFDRRL